MNNLFDMIHGAQPALRPAPNQVAGVVVGTVQDIRDPESIGRIKVSYTWLASGSDESVNIETDQAPAHSGWARIALLSAGKGRGTWFVPEVGDEVLVGFEHGELDRPIIVGTLWNVQDTPPDKLKMDREGKNNLRGIYTRSGHKIVFDDSDDQPSILIEDQTGENAIRIDSKTNSMAIKVQGDLTITVGGALTIRAGQALSVETEADLAVKAQGQGSLTTTGALALKSNSQTVVEGKTQADLKGASVNVNGSAATVIKGGVVRIN